MGLRLCLIFMLSFAFGLSGLVAHAQSDESRDRARTLFQQGVSRFEAGDFSAALASFEAAYEIAPHPSVRVNMANCLEQLGRYSEAIENYESYLNETPSLRPAQRADMAKAVERLSRHLGTIDVQLSPAQAQLTVDGALPNRNANGAVIVAPGEHVLRASRDGYESTQRIVQVEVGSSQTLALQLEPLPAPEPVVPLVAEPGAPLETEPGRGHEPEPSASGHSRIWLWTAAGTAALLTVGFATTAGLTYRAQGDFDYYVDLSRDTQRPLAVRDLAYADASDAKDRAERLALVSDVLLGSALVATGATLVIWLVGKRRADFPLARLSPLARLRARFDRARFDQQPAALNAQPMLLRHAAGLSLRGQF